MVLTEEERKERNRISSKKYYINNKEKQSVRNKKYRESEKGKEAQKKYRKSEKGKITLSKIQSKYYQNNIELNKERTKNYKQTLNGKKANTKGHWKSYGLNMENFEEIYNRYTMAIFCDICECVLEGNGNNKKCMDHDHDTGDFRNIVCHYCNVQICK